MVDRKLDIFEAMEALDLRRGDWFAAQPEDARKSFAPPVFLRWASTVGDGVQAEAMLERVNERVNLCMWTHAQDHPELVFRLAASCGTGRRQRHAWVPMTAKRQKASRVRAFVAEQNPGINDIEIDIVLSGHTRRSFAEYVESCGVDPSEAKEVIKAHDKQAPKDPASAEEQAKPKRKRNRGA